MVRKSFRVKQSKTQKLVTCDLTPRVAKAITAYLAEQHPAPEDDSAPLFPSRNRDTAGNPKPLDRRRVWQIVRRDCEAVGLTGGTYSPHSWRKSWGRAALDAGVPMAVAQEKLGHRRPGALLAYLGVTRDDVRAASVQIEL